ncbi:hypothetical protein [Rahnella sp. WP5]|uniref:hypothetical protein n=1 Tax=Rahnella sp. WP5 TaxID=1500266 RepID=UPI001E33D56B|nr:hypothetical protein [Rahnella sp. WP5]
MSNITIDFNKLVVGSNKKLFAGRANGKTAYDYFEVNLFNVESDDTLSLSIPDGVVVSSSYFLGLLEKILPKFSSPKDLYKRTKLDGKSYQEGMLAEFDRAVKRGLHRNEPFF